MAAHMVNLLRLEIVTTTAAAESFNPARLLAEISTASRSTHALLFQYLSSLFFVGTAFALEQKVYREPSAFVEHHMGMPSTAERALFLIYDTATGRNCS
jgi:cytochrome bd-type quinol oxidase subunit 1